MTEQNCLVNKVIFPSIKIMGDYRNRKIKKNVNKEQLPIL